MVMNQGTNTRLAMRKRANARVLAGMWGSNIFKLMKVLAQIIMVRSKYRLG